MLKTSIYCAVWLNKITLNQAIRNKKVLIDEDTCWKFGGDEVQGGNEGLGEKSSFKVKSGGWDLISGEKSKFDDSKGKLITFSYLG